MSLEQARVQAMKLIDGAAPAAAMSSMTFSGLVDQYVGSSEFRGLASRTQTSYRVTLRSRHYAPWTGRRAASITRLDILALKDHLVDQGLHPSNVIRPLMRCFAWALDRGLIENSPTTRLRLPKNTADPHPYAEKEMGRVVAAIEQMAEPWRSLGLLVAYTGQRPSTWERARRAEVDLTRGILAVAPVRAASTKLGKPWAIPLSAQAVRVLEGILARTEGVYVWGHQPIMVHQKVRDELALRAGLGDGEHRASLHRLRSTLATWMDREGVPTEDALRLLGHAAPMAGARSHYVARDVLERLRVVVERYEQWIQFCGVLA